jgi:YjbE family integral membrane protein
VWLLVTAVALITSALKITFIDIVLSGDNAVVIAMAARSLPKEQQKKAVFWGGAAAIALRVCITALVAYALAIPLLQLGGGVLLFAIACKLLKGGGEEAHDVKASKSLTDAVLTIVLADFVMSLDNMLAVGGASHGSMPLLLLGLAISMGIIMFASGFIADLMNKFNWLVYAGAAILAWTSGEMILSDRWLHKIYEAGPVMHYAVPALMAAAVIGFGLMVNRKKGDADEEAA